MSGSLTRVGGENVPGIPGACTTRNFTQFYVSFIFAGSGHGLKLTLNIEQYEHILGAHTDAGVKVLVNHVNIYMHSLYSICVPSLIIRGVIY